MGEKWVMKEQQAWGHLLVWETVGKEVRETIKKLGGTMPENLPAEESIKKLTGKQLNKMLKNKTE